MIKNPFAKTPEKKLKSILEDVRKKSAAELIHSSEIDLSMLNSLKKENRAIGVISDPQVGEGERSRS